MSITLRVVTVSWGDAYVQTHQMVHSKYVKLLGYQLYLDKAIFKKWVHVQVGMSVHVCALSCVSVYVTIFLNRVGDLGLSSIFEYLLISTLQAHMI